MKTGDRLIGSSSGPIVVGTRLGKGGQGDVFAVVDRPEHVLKAYHESELEKSTDLATRIGSMVRNPPQGWQEATSKHVTVAWPTETCFDGDRFVGFLMPRINRDETVEVHEVANITSRNEDGRPTDWTAWFNDWARLVQTARNLARDVEVLHHAGVIIGDFNERNILVHQDARVTLVDCDSMQFKDKSSGKYFLCSVGRADFTPPELIGVDWKTTVRQQSSDRFALAVHLHQLLLEAEHPFRGVWHNENEQKPPEIRLAAQGTWVGGSDGRLRPRPGAVTDRILSDEVRKLFGRAFEVGAKDPNSRPSATEWVAALERMLQSLQLCPTNPKHHFVTALPSCPWCNSPVGAPGTQTPLPPPPTAVILPPPSTSGAAPPVTGISSIPSPPGVRPTTMLSATAALRVTVPTGGGTANAKGGGHSPVVYLLVAALVIGGIMFYVRKSPSQRVAATATAATAPATIVITTQTPTTAGSASTTPAATPTPTTTTATAAAPTTPSPTQPPTTVERGIAAKRELDATVAADRPRLAKLVNQWVPQLSAKQLGTNWKDITYDYPAILDEYKSLNSSFGAVLASGSDLNFKLPPGDWYLTLVDEGFATGEQALRWCSDHAIGSKDCFAKLISTDQSISKTVMLNPE